METAVAVTSRLAVAGGSRFSLSARPKTTKANSPPGASSSAAWTEAVPGIPARLPTPATTAALMSSSARMTGTIVVQPVTISERSMEKPTVTKNRPNNIPRKGAMSASTWCRYCVSESRTPPKKAPSVLERPRPSVTLEQRSTVPRVMARKASGDFDRMTKVKILSSTTLPRKKIIESARMPRAEAAARAPPRLPPPAPASRGTTTSSGTTARSWKSSTPKDARP
mmetsp:Transcript_14768/g.46470  ORF Transcript_14768/g.46470 Transcript_14768/m.46470 type:complete len:225 (-) Transcript_14768:689-1363(-)